MSLDKERDILRLTSEKERLFRRLQAMVDLIKKDLRTEKVLAEFCVRLDQLEPTYERLNIVLSEIINLEHQLELKDAGNSANQAASAVDDMYVYIKTTAKMFCPSSSSSSMIETPLAQVRFPEIELQHFNGTLRDWPAFYDNFRLLIHDNRRLSNVAKFQYLLSALSGPALTIARSLPLTDDNYNVVWQNLIKAFDNKRLLAITLLESLFSFQVITSESLPSLNAFLTTYCESVTALKTAGIEDLGDFILLYISLRKLPSETRRRFELRCSNEVTPTVAELFELVRQEVSALEFTKISDDSLSATTSKGKPGNVARTKVLTASPSIRRFCLYCNDSHFIHTCKQFRRLSIADRAQWITQKKICNNCLKDKHNNQSCPSQVSCKRCGERHHTLLHVEGAKANTSVNSCHSLSAAKVTLLGTALGYMKSASGRLIQIRLLLDSGSTSSFITTSLIKALGIPYDKQSISITGLGNKRTSSTGTCSASLYSTNLTSTVYVDLIIVPTITSVTPSSPISNAVVDKFNGLQLADPTFNIPGPINVLLGADVFMNVLRGQTLAGQPSAINTMFGWVVMGSSSSNSNLSDAVALIGTPAHTLDDAVKRFWQWEEPPEISIPHPDDEQAEKQFVNNVALDQGRFVVPLLLRDHPVIGNSFQGACSRFYNLERRLNRNSDLRSAYVAFMDAYVTAGHMDLVPAEYIGKAKYYIPHHGIFKDGNVTSKIRVVFDASMKASNDVSLNDLLFTGPKLQRHISDVVSRFRLHAFVMTTDICQMYRQILICPEQRTYQHILWRSSSEQPLQEFRLNTVTYGLRSSPYLALRCLKELADKYTFEYPGAASVLYKDIYVDDILTGADTLSGARALQQELVSLLRHAGFELKKWAANDPDLLTDVPVDDRQSTLSFADENDNIIHILGLKWNSVSDEFQYVVRPFHFNVWTKRNILSSISRLYDPLGWITPVIFTAKVLIQRLWAASVGWDDPIPENIRHDWLEFASQLPCLETLTLSRRATVPDASCYRLIAFCDASEKGYASCVYLQAVGLPDMRAPILITAKAKVAPLKSISIPRLELQACVLGVRLLKQVQLTLSDTLNISNISAFTDSSVVLSWLRIHPANLKIFVSHRVVEIIDSFPTSIWHHVSSPDNPADVASRGCRPKDILSHLLWWNGPSFLSNHEWNSASGEVLPLCDLPELKSTPTALVASVNPVECDLIVRYSSLTKLIHITAWVLRFLNVCRSVDKAKCRDVISLTHTECASALDRCIQVTQSTFYQDVFDKIAGNRLVPRSLQKLSPFVDSCGFLRVGGRLANADLTSESKRPLLLPGKCHFTRLLIRQIHVDNLHAGPQLVRTILCRRYWVVSARRVIRSVLHECVKCFKAHPSSLQPSMAPLPLPRVTFTKPFADTGVDFAGPFKIKDSHRRGRSITRDAYLCLFVCLSTRALHLECVSDLSTEAFLAALDRFVSRRGQVNNMYSDCGRNFVGAARHLQEMYALLLSAAEKEVVSRALTQREITWHFNPPYAPHFGGLWEAGVKSVKGHIRRSIGIQILTYEEYSTLFCRVESILNSRPLCAISSDPTDYDVLTPNHFLTGVMSTAIPEADLSHLSTNRLSRWQLIRQMTQSVWKHWHSEYMNTLRQRQKWLTPRDTVAINDLVILKEANTPPLSWRLGRVTRVHPGRDGVVRVATINTASGEVLRPVVKLCRLPVE